MSCISADRRMMAKCTPEKEMSTVFQSNSNDHGEDDEHDGNIILFLYLIIVRKSVGFLAESRPAFQRLAWNIHITVS